MSTEKRQAKALDDALRGGEASDETRPLTETAETLRRALATDVPPADRQRALFLSGVSRRGRARFSPARVVVPAMGIGLLVFAMIAGSNARPGEQLYPLREAMNAVGIGEAPLTELNEHLAEANALIERGDEYVDENPNRALGHGIRAIQRLGLARDLLPELTGQREEKLDEIEDIEDEALDLIEDALENRADEGDDGSSDDGSSDDSGGDNSGSGSGDSGGDNSGSGSDDSSGDDSSGPGSGDSDDSGTDNSGSGSDDSSGDDSGSGSDDSGTSGSGGDSDSSGSGG